MAIKGKQKESRRGAQSKDASKPKKSVSAKKEQGPLSWRPLSVSLSSLKPFERNPRLISKTAFDQLVKSLREDGYHQRIIATPDLRVIGGHQRIAALKQIGLKEIEILVASRMLTDKEYRRILVRDNLPFGEFDFDILSADYDRDELVQIGMPESWLPEMPGEESEEDTEQSSGDDVEPQIIKCPSCEHEFSIMTEKKKKR